MRQKCFGVHYVDHMIVRQQLGNESESLEAPRGVVSPKEGFFAWRIGVKRPENWQNEQFRGLLTYSVPGRYSTSGADDNWIPPVLAANSVLCSSKFGW
jgi:hypothetical protein